MLRSRAYKIYLENNIIRVYMQNVHIDTDLLKEKLNFDQNLVQEHQYHPLTWCKKISIFYMNNDTVHALS